MLLLNCETLFFADDTKSFRHIGLLHHGKMLLNHFVSLIIISNLLLLMSHIFQPEVLHYLYILSVATCMITSKHSHKDIGVTFCTNLNWKTWHYSQQIL